MPAHAFVYGTLMAPEVVTSLIKRMPRFKTATLSGYSRSKVQGQVFPAIIPCKDASVVGMVLLDLTPAELTVLDVYESVEYERVSVNPVLEDGAVVEASVYVWKEELRHMLQLEPWTYETWREDHLEEWVTTLSPDAAHP